LKQPHPISTGEEEETSYTSGRIKRPYLSPMSRLLKEKWNEILIRCIDRGLDVFGDSTKRVVYWNFEQHFNLKKEDIPDHVIEFSTMLRKIFGVGSESVEGRICAEIRSSVNIGFSPSPVPGCDDFATFVGRARQEFLKRVRENTLERSTK
jgi:hypothetical protein